MRTSLCAILGRSPATELRRPLGQKSAYALEVILRGARDSLGQGLRLELLIESVRDGGFDQPLCQRQRRGGSVRQPRSHGSEASFEFAGDHDLINESQL